MNVIFFALIAIAFVVTGFHQLTWVAPSADAVASYASAAPEEYDLPGGFNKPAHQPHLENFFASVRGQAR